MNDPSSRMHDPPPHEEKVPFGQRLFDSPFVLLLIGIVVMAVSFTAWGLWEILTLPPAPLP